MVRTSTAVLGAVGALALAAGTWSVYQRTTTAETPYTVVARVDDVELRRYPATVLVETTAASEAVAFRRLFGYLSGDNDGGVDVPMTAPVEVTGRGTEIPMTAPVEVERRERGGPAARPVDGEGGEVRMAFYLPDEYDVGSAPRPTNDAVELVEAPERTLAVRRFSWRPTDRRVTRQTEELLATLERAKIGVAGEPFFLGYDAPWTLPALRRNEVAVEVDAGGR